MGLGRKYLNFSNGVLDYANRGSYLFYILHQTVIVLVRHTRATRFLFGMK